LTGGPADKPQKRPGRSRLFGTGVLGALIGIGGSQLLPVADTLAGALTDTGFGPRAAWAIILCLFAVGGIEGSLLLRPFIARDGQIRHASHREPPSKLR